MTHFAPRLHKVVREFATATELTNWLTLPHKVDLVLFIAALGGGVDYGNFYLFLNEDDAAHIWLHEHQEYIPIELGAHDSGNTFMFRYENGEIYEVPAREVLSRERAVEALYYWLPNQSHLPTLEWR